ncbi:MAG: lysoplasmalogenase [Deltaproteobacteria bacterium]|nr:lysoplasmalogenase [Deltaproteobacteria bacterium]MBN2672002.1 lysoplasmalogenase [Deltaproteobacteria bacterium]
MLKITLLLCTFFVALQIYFEYRHHRGKPGPYVGITKTIASAAFVIAAIFSDIFLASNGTTILIGLLLCLVGDVFLISQKKLFFMMGLVSFLFAHIAYCVAFIAQTPYLVALLIAAPALFAIGFTIGKWLLPKVGDNMKKPVAAYIITICCMVALSIGAAFANHQWQLMVAAILFMISDIFVAKDRFIESTFLNRLFGLPLYYGAQLLFATGHYWFPR